MNFLAATYYSFLLVRPLIKWNESIAVTGILSLSLSLYRFIVPSRYPVNARVDGAVCHTIKLKRLYTTELLMVQTIFSICTAHRL